MALLRGLSTLVDAKAQHKVPSTEQLQCNKTTQPLAVNVKVPWLFSTSASKTQKREVKLKKETCIVSRAASVFRGGGRTLTGTAGFPRLSS